MNLLHMLSYCNNNIICNHVSVLAGIKFKVTVDLQGCLPKNHSHARVLSYNHRKVYIIVKVIKCRIIGNIFFLDLI